MRQSFIMLVGFSRSGKTTLAKKIKADLGSQITWIDVDTIHDFLNTKYPIFQDDNTIDGKSFELRQQATSAMRSALTSILLKHGVSVLYDSTNLARSERKETLKQVKIINNKITTIIIHIDTPEDQLYQRLQRHDQNLQSKGGKPTWVALYEKIQRPKFEKPKASEGDYLFTYTGINDQELLKNIKKAVSK